LSAFVSHGKLLPDNIIFKLLSKRWELGDSIGETGFILDGFPRTRIQAKILDRVADIDMAINFKCKEEDNLIKRCLGRRTCAQCGRTFNIANTDAKIHMPSMGPPCACLGKLITSTSDTEEILKEKLRIYSEQLEEFFLITESPMEAMAISQSIVAVEQLIVAVVQSIVAVEQLTVAIVQSIVAAEQLTVTVVQSIVAVLKPHRRLSNCLLQKVSVLSQDREKRGFETVANISTFIIYFWTSWQFSKAKRINPGLMDVNNHQEWAEELQNENLLLY
ncbi:hypothetical protein KI387_013827, partial [Taxus chinensis]